MKEKEYICPYCRSKDVTEWGSKIEIGKREYRIVYRCYSCARFFDVRKIEGCDKQMFHHGDNYPLLPMQKDWCKEREEHAKFKDKGIVPKAKKDDIVNLLIDLWIFLKDKVKEKNGKNIN